MNAGHVIEIERPGGPQVVVVVVPVHMAGDGGEGGQVYEVRDVQDAVEPPRGALAHALRVNSGLAWWTSFACGVLILLQLLGD